MGSRSLALALAKPLPAQKPLLWRIVLLAHPPIPDRQNDAFCDGNVDDVASDITVKTAAP
jgi:hypothetical protein